MVKAESNINKQRKRCGYCGNPLLIIWVHGHGQCAACGINVEECCRGERRYVNSQERITYPSTDDVRK